MNWKTDGALLDQRHDLRRRMLAQRQLIAYQLEPVPRADGGYPRSKLMRTLTGHPLLSAGLLASLATLLGGARVLKPLIGALALAKLLRGTAHAPAARRDAPRDPPRSDAG